MKYAWLIYSDEAEFDRLQDTPAVAGVMEGHRAFAVDMGSAIVGGSRLESPQTATTVRTRGAEKSLHDGPFAETKEQLGGFYLIDVPDLDAAIAAARKIPMLSQGCVEIRPVGA